MPKRANATSFGGIKGNKPGASGAHGKGGARPATFRNRMALLAARAKTAKNVEKILDDPKHPAFMKALEFAADRGFGKVPQAVTGPDGDALVIRIVRDDRPGDDG